MDRLNDIIFLKIDEEILNDNQYINYKNADIYLLHYILGNKLEYSPGKIKAINENNGNIFHTCSTEEGSSGGPLLNSLNYKIIGVHKGSQISINLGTVIKKPIEEFNKIFKNGKNNNKEKIMNNDHIEQVVKDYSLSKKNIEEISIKFSLLEKGVIFNEDESRKKVEKEEKSLFLHTKAEEYADEITLKYQKKESGLFNTINSFLINNVVLKEDVSDNKIFGEKFVENNRNNCTIIIDGKKQMLCSSYNIPSKNILEIKLKGINKIIDMSYMLYGCSSFITSPDISKWNTNKVNNMSNVFMNCSSILSLPDISKWDLTNVTNISNMFQGCKSLISIPDISKWNTENVIDMSGIFWNCNSLSQLPDISKWKTNNVINMSYMFCLCNSLNFLPDLSEWKTDKVTDMSYMFNRCYSLTTLKGISKWNTKNVTNMSYMFCECKALLNMDDISKWNTSNLKDFEEMFNNCNNNVRIPLRFIKKKKWTLF